MMEALRRLYAGFRGFDEAGSAVPMMDGPLKPNTVLDEAPVVLRLPEIDNLTAIPAGLFGSQGAGLFRLRILGEAMESVEERTFSSAITCLAADASGALAIGLDGQGIMIHGGRHDGLQIKELSGAALRSPSAALFLDPDTLVVANGSAEFMMADWKRDLMTRRSSGSVWRIALGESGEAIPLARNLAFPYGLARDASGGVLASESWRHRIVALDSGKLRTMLTELPAYPARIAPAADGGHWLALFAPRNQLVEFVLREESYCRRMVTTIDPAYWIAPSLVSGTSFLEPIQGGARKKLNMLKPWSPSWSYGLVVRCDAQMRPLESFHSRADGAFHGVTSLAESDGSLFVGAKGSGAIAQLQGVSR
jgi:hypothetical protein